MSDKKAKNILIVEDEAIIAEAEAAMLRKNGYSVLNAYNGDEAVRIAAADPSVDLILMDIALGKGIDGPEAAKLILEKRRLPILFLTFHAEREIVEKVKTVTHYGYVIKDAGSFVILSSIEMAFRLFEAHERLREREEKYRLLAENSTDIIWTMDLSGCFTYLSPSIERLTGYTPDEMYEVPLDRHLAFPSARTILDDLARELAKPREERSVSRTLEVKIKRRDGSVFDAEVNVGWIVNDRGDVCGVQGSTRDISSRKRMESDLAMERSQLLSVFDNIDEAVYVVDMDTYEVLFANKKLNDTFGKPLVGGICYRELQGFDSPCPFCTNDIIRGIPSHQPYRWEFHNPVVNRYYQITDRVIRWPDGRDVRFEMAVDITESRSVKERLEETAEHNKAMLSAIPDLIFLFDRAGTFLEYNEFVDENRILVSPDRFLRKNVREVLPADVAELTLKHLDLLFRTGEQQRYDYTLDVTGRREYFEARMVMCGEDKALASVRDVTEKREAEEKLRLREELLNAVFESVSDTIFSKDKNLRYVRMNSAMLRDLGVSASDIIGKADSEIYTPDVAAQFEESDRRALAGEPVESFPVIPIRGRIRHFHTMKVPLRDAGGSVSGICGIARDITDLKKAEEALRASERAYATLVENAGDMIARFDTDLRHIYCNPAVERILGIPMNAMIGKRPSETKGAAVSAPLMEECLRKALASGTETEVQFGIPAASDPPNAAAADKKSFMTRVIPERDENGRIVSLLAITRDVTMLKRTERRLEEALSERETLLKETYHRVKNNFQSICAMLNLQIAASESPEVSDALRETSNRIEAMAMVHERLYRAADLESIDLADFLYDLADNLVSVNSPERRRIRLEFEGEEIYARMGQAIPCGLIVNELVTNSGKHAFPDGWDGDPMIRVSVRKRRNGSVILEVRDNGKGLSPGFRSRESKSLGLSLVFLLAEQLGGMITPAHEGGAGFIIEFSPEGITDGR